MCASRLQRDRDGPAADDRGLRRSRATRRRSSQRGLLVGALVLGVGVAAAAVVGSVVDTAESRFAGVTDNRGSLLEAGEVRLELVTDQPEAEVERSELAIVGSDLLPGQTVERCIVVGYSGSVDSVDLRLYGGADENDELARFLDTRIDVGSGFDPDCADFSLPEIDPVSWIGELNQFAVTADSFATGLPVLDDTPSETTATVRVRLTLANDNRAQGLSAAFWLAFEVRP
ncbi:MAG: hypothetical protein AAGG08_02780 [Actinomycetota bacterium]